MRTRIFPIIAVSGIAACLAACSSQNTIIPEATPRPPAAQAPKPSAPIVSRPLGEWRDWPIASGDWVYRTDDRGSIALFGMPQRDALITLRCDKTRGRVYLARASQSEKDSVITVRTSSALKQLNASPTGGTPPYIAAELMPNDSILDAIVYTRGRIALEGQGQQSIAIPIWSEVAKVVEDCRK
jgi:hypothetical protein